MASQGPAALARAVSAAAGRLDAPRHRARPRHAARAAPDPPADPLLDAAARRARRAATPERALDAGAPRGGPGPQGRPAPGSRPTSCGSRGPRSTTSSSAPTALGVLDEALALEPDHLDARLERAGPSSSSAASRRPAPRREEVLDAAPATRPGPTTCSACSPSGAATTARRSAASSGPGPSTRRPSRPPVAMTRADFAALVEAALDGHPGGGAAPPRQRAGHRWRTCPSDDDLTASDPPLSPGSLGMFRGAPFGQKGSARRLEPAPLLHRPLPAQPGAGRHPAGGPGGGDPRHPGPRDRPLPRARRGGAGGARAGVSGVVLFP